MWRHALKWRRIGRRGRSRWLISFKPLSVGRFRTQPTSAPRWMGCVIMGLGAALTEEIRFKNGRITNALFADYQVPRFREVPNIDTVLLDRRDLPSVGGSETPIIAVAPAIGNAVFDADGRAVAGDADARG